MTLSLRTRRLLVAFSGGALCWAAFVLSGSYASIAQDSTNPDQSNAMPHPLVNTHELMELFNEPLYKSLQKTLRSTPQDDQWDSVQEDAMRLAEVANLISIRDRSDQQPRWNTLAKGLQESAQRLAVAADGKDYESSRAIYMATIKQCNQCHQEIEPGAAPQIDAFEK